MIELVIFNYLKEKLDVPVSMEEIPDDEFVLVSKTGSGRENLISSALISIQSYSKSLYGAALLNEKVKSAMFEINELAEVGSCKLNTDYEFSDSSTKKYRYQAVFDIYHY